MPRFGFLHMHAQFRAIRTKILASPTGHSGVVGADLEEELAVHPEEAAGHGRRGRRVARLPRAVVLERNPVEMPGPGGSIKFYALPFQQ